MPESNYRVVSYRSKTAHPERSSGENSPRQKRELDRLTGISPAKTVSVSLKQIVPLLIDAAESNRNWLEDFAEDQVRIDTDLYDVLLAYQHMRRHEAA